MKYKFSAFVKKRTDELAVYRTFLLGVLIKKILHKLTRYKVTNTFWVKAFFVSIGKKQDIKKTCAKGRGIFRKIY